MGITGTNRAEQTVIKRPNRIYPYEPNGKQPTDPATCLLGNGA